MTQITAVRCALPPYRHRQAELTSMFGELNAVDPGRRPLLERLHANAGVDTRHTVLPLAEYARLDGIGPTNDLYIERATALGEQAVRSALLTAGLDASDLDMLIVTSVTGVAVPSLDARLGPAEPAGGVRGAGPLRQDVRCRVYGSVLLVGDASGYIDALTGEGISVGLAQAAALVECLQSGSVAGYEQAWRRVSRKSRLLTAGLLWSRHRSLLAPHIVPAAEHFPRLFTSIVNHVAAA